LLLQQKRSLTRLLKEAFYKRILGRKERETELKTKKVDRKSEKGAKTMNKSLLLFLSFDSWI